MKTYKDYYKEYEQTLPSNEPAPINENERSLWILCKWEQDNNINPCDGEKYISKVREVYETDNRLYFQLEQAFTLLNKIELNLN